MAVTRDSDASVCPVTSAGTGGRGPDPGGCLAPDSVRALGPSSVHARRKAAAAAGKPPAAAEKAVVARRRASLRLTVMVPAMKDQLRRRRGCRRREARRTQSASAAYPWGPQSR